MNICYVSISIPFRALASTFQFLAAYSLGPLNWDTRKGKGAVRFWIVEGNSSQSL